MASHRLQLTGKKPNEESRGPSYTGIHLLQSVHRALRSSMNDNVLFKRISWLVDSAFISLDLLPQK